MKFHSWSPSSSISSHTCPGDAREDDDESTNVALVIVVFRFSSMVTLDEVCPSKLSEMDAMPPLNVSIVPPPSARAV